MGKTLFFQAPVKTEKVSDQIIVQIRDAILSGRFKPGDRLASEKELIDEFGVSKASMREALRVLETMGLVEIRKGISGGVFIAEVDMRTTIHGIMNFLHFKSVSIRDITMLRYILEPNVARLAAARIKAEDAKKLEEVIAAENIINPSDQGITFHRYLARLTENPILILIMDFIDNMLSDIKAQLHLSADFYAKVQENHQEILACLAVGDGEAAARAITRDLLVVGDMMAEAKGTPRFDPGLMDPDQAMVARQDYTGHPAATGIKPEDLTELRKKGLLFQKVGTGELYMFVRS